MTDSFDNAAVTALVERFCRARGIADATRLRVVPNLHAAFDVLALKGPDARWKTIASRACVAGDFPESPGHQSADMKAERMAYAHALREYARVTRSGWFAPSPSWCLRHVVVSAAHWARFSRSLRSGHGLGLGWIVPANKDLLIVPRPALRTLEDSSAVLHDDSGRMAVQWADGTGYYFLRGTPFGEELYSRIINGRLSLEQVASLGNADHRSIALSYMSFEQLVTNSQARLLDVGAKGTALYRLALPDRIARDRVRGYGGYDYFIHMRDASHPDREFIEWVDPRIGVRGDAELCQAHAFGITLQQWLSVEQEG